MKTVSTIGLVLVALIFTSHAASAQYGTVTGEVVDVSSGKPVEGVTVVLQGTSYLAVTDRDGRYILNRAPSGDYDLLFEINGYETGSFPVVISTGGYTVLNAELQARFIGGNQFFDIEPQKEWSRVDARKKHIPHVREVMTSAKMALFQDYQIRSSLMRMSGVQVGRRGEINLRGTGRNVTSVSVDGQRLPASGMGERWVDTEILSTFMAYDVELVKVITPDMDPEGLGGSVHINSWRPIGGRELNIKVGGMANPRYFNYSGPDNVAHIQYSEKLRPDFSISSDLFYQKEHNGFESLVLNYDAADFGNGFVDVMESVAPALHLDERTRLGGRLQMKYQPSPQSTFHLTTSLNQHSRNRDIHRITRSAGGDWIDPTATGEVGEQGTYVYDASILRSDDRQYYVQAGGRHLLKWMNIGYKAGWVKTSIDQSDYLFPFVTQRLDYDISMDDRKRPQMVINNLRLFEDGSLEPRRLDYGGNGGQPTRRVLDEHKEDRYSANVDAEVPFRFGAFKIGTGFQHSDRDGAYDDVNLLTLRRYNLMRFDAIPLGSIDVMDEYLLPWLINTDRARYFLETNKPALNIDEDNNLKNSQIWNYFASESIYSAYGMMTLNIGPATLIGGGRFEQTSATYEGHIVRFNRFDAFDSSELTKESVNHTHFFPNAHVIISPIENSNLRIAYSRNIERHHYNALTPFELTNSRDTTRFSGNPDLKPALSDNIDVIFEQYTSYSGAFSVGFFYKEIENLLMIDERVVEESSFPTMEIPENETVMVHDRTYTNRDDGVTVYGLEVSFRQNLAFLPGILGNFGIFGNYTWSQSEQVTGRNGEKMDLLYQSPHVVNASLDYQQGRFQGQVAWHRTAPSLSSISSERRIAPAISSSEAVYLDRYEDGWSDLSASFRFRISDRFRIWLAASNLIRPEYVTYAEDRDLYPYETDVREGFRFSAGLNFSL